MAVFIGKEIVAQIELKLDNKCSYNQDKQLAIIKALEGTGSIYTTEINPSTATIFTDNRITLDSLQNANKHAYLI